MPGWEPAGSWGDPLREHFDLVVFLRVPTEERLKRLKQREVERFGDEALEPGGSMHEHHLEFLAWAARYDDGDHSVRSLRLHEDWLASLSCPVLRLDGELPTDAQVEQVARYGDDT